MARGDLVPAEDYARLISDLRGAIAVLALAHSDGHGLLRTVGERLREAGVPVSRLSVAWRTLDPLIFAQQIIWTRGALEAEAFSHADADAEAGRQSPLRHVVDNELERYRFNLTANDLPFEQFVEFAAAGHTDYIAGVERFGPLATGDGDGMFLSACSDAPGGFGEAFEVFLAVRPTLALAFRAIIERRKAETVARTYLGALAARRVLAGSIRRGDAEVIPAAIWYSDLRSFTPMSEALALDDTIGLLNEVFEATAGAVEAAGGHVLDFIGDAVLAIFPLEDGGVRRALAALDVALLRLDALRAAWAADSRPAVAGTLARGLVGIALAVGDVRFGNIGTTGRLSYSVIGPTVNTVARIEGLTKLLGEPVLVTEAIADAAPERFVPRGSHPLEGVAEPPALFALAGAPHQVPDAALPTPAPVAAPVL